MTDRFDCFDCSQAAQRPWPCFAAGCEGCIARALASVKTPPPTVTITNRRPNWKTGEPGEFRVDVLFDSPPPKSTEDSE